MLPLFLVLTPHEVRHFPPRLAASFLEELRLVSLVLGRWELSLNLEVARVDVFISHSWSSSAILCLGSFGSWFVGFHCQGDGACTRPWVLSAAFDHHFPMFWPSRSPVSLNKPCLRQEERVFLEWEECCLGSNTARLKS